MAADRSPANKELANRWTFRHLGQESTTATGPNARGRITSKGCIVLALVNELDLERLSRWWACYWIARTSTDIRL